MLGPEISKMNTGLPWSLKRAHSLMRRVTERNFTAQAII